MHEHFLPAEDADCFLDFKQLYFQLGFLLAKTVSAHADGHFHQDFVNSRLVCHQVVQGCQSLVLRDQSCAWRILSGSLCLIRLLFLFLRFFFEFLEILWHFTKVICVAYSTCFYSLLQGGCNRVYIWIDILCCLLLFRCARNLGQSCWWFLRTYLVNVVELFQSVSI